MLALSFLAVWLFGMTAGISARACRHDRYEGVEKLMYCNISISSGGFLDIFPTERARRSKIHLERSIALVQLMRDVEATKSLKEAFQAGSAGSLRADLLKRIDEMEDQKVRLTLEKMIEYTN